MLLSYRWDYYQFQLSAPVYLEKEQPYYFEVLGNQYSYRWEVGLGVKLHDSTLSGGRYNADREQQKISITSSIAREEQVRTRVRLTCVFTQNLARCTHQQLLAGYVNQRDARSNSNNKPIEHT